jgi:hypothetical protein
MEYEELTAADRYVTAESSDNEPISSMKQPGEKCDLCACNPCQCGKMRKTGGTGNDPYEVCVHAPHCVECREAVG